MVKGRNITNINSQVVQAQYTRLSNNRTVWNNHTGRKNSLKLLTSQYEIILYRIGFQERIITRTQYLNKSA